MSVLKIASVGGLAALTMAPLPAVSQTVSTNFNVQITITAECQINSASNLNFGSNGVIDDNIDVTSAVVVQCTSGVPYSVGLSAGGGANATIANRVMTGTGGTISYSLYTNAGRTAVWGDVTGNLQAGTGTGEAQTYNVYGRVPAQTTPSSGTYTDVVTATLNY